MCNKSPEQYKHIERLAKVLELLLYFAEFDYELTEEDKDRHKKELEILVNYDFFRKTVDGKIYPHCLDDLYVQNCLINIITDAINGVDLEKNKGTNP